jgi:type 1 glutamine amidotransferase
LACDAVGDGWQVLLRVRDHKNGEDRAAAWAREDESNCRAFFFGPGHEGSVYQAPEVKSLLLDAIRWASWGGRPPVGS